MSVTGLHASLGGQSPVILGQLPCRYARPVVSPTNPTIEVRDRSALIKALGRLELYAWPELRASLRTPRLLNPPAPRQFASFGENSWVVPPARVAGAGRVAIGSNVVLMEHVNIQVAPGSGTVVTIGDGSHLARFATIWATVGVHIGKKVLSSDYISLLDSWDQPNGRLKNVPGPKGAPIVIEDGAYLGAGCIIGPGVTVGEGSFVGEGAVVFDDVPKHAVVYGNPAQVTRQWSEGEGWT
jgi:acetyltransferase-like isoleucine patch superfamily enzyme